MDEVMTDIEMVLEVYKDVDVEFAVELEIVGGVSIQWLPPTYYPATLRKPVVLNKSQGRLPPMYGIWVGPSRGGQ
jgi:hypothetical protein